MTMMLTTVSDVSLEDVSSDHAELGSDVKIVGNEMCIVYYGGLGGDVLIVHWTHTLSMMPDGCRRSEWVLHIHPPDGSGRQCIRRIQWLDDNLQEMQKALKTMMCNN